MKIKDRRIIEISLPKTEQREAIRFNIGFKDLKDSLKIAKENGWKKIKFDIEGSIIEVDFETIVQIYRYAKYQFINLYFTIPKNIQDYLIDSFKSTFVDEKLYYRDEELDRLWSCIISDSKSNAILVGYPGVGKTTIVIEAAKQLKTMNAPRALQGYRIIELKTQELLEIKSNLILELTIKRILEFLKQNKSRVILYIDNLLYMKYDIWLAKMLICILKKYNIKLLASISIDDFEEFFEEDFEIGKYLNPIYIEEPDIEEIFPMLKTRIESMQEKYKVKISDKMIHFAIFTGYHMSSSNSANPENTLDVINFALADAKRIMAKEVNKNNILRYYFINFKLDKKIAYSEKEAIAYHESGHYIVKRFTSGFSTERNAFVSILPFEDAGGLTASYTVTGQKFFYNKEDFIYEIADCLGGRVGEELLTNKYSSGASTDLSMANTIAEQCILAYGLSEDNSQNSYYTSNGLYLLSDEQKERINEEKIKLVNQGFELAKKTITEHKELHKIIVNKLLEENILMGSELEEICEEYSKNLIL